MTVEKPKPNINKSNYLKELNITDGISVVDILRKQNIEIQQLTGMDMPIEVLHFSDPDNFPWHLVTGKVIPLSLNSDVDGEYRMRLKMHKAQIMKDDAIYALVECRGISENNVFWTLSLISPKTMKRISEQGGPITDYIMGV